MFYERQCVRANFHAAFYFSHVGILSAVDNLTYTVENSTLSLTWRPPFSLNLTGIEPDILYCVDVVSVVSGATLSECGIVVTIWTYFVPFTSGCDSFRFVVTPVNAAGNGTTSAVALFSDCKFLCMCSIVHWFMLACSWLHEIFSSVILEVIKHTCMKWGYLTISS